MHILLAVFWFVSLVFVALLGELHLSKPMLLLNKMAFSDLGQQILNQTDTLGSNH